MFGPFLAEICSSFPKCSRGVAILSRSNSKEGIRNSVGGASKSLRIKIFVVEKGHVCDRQGRLSLCGCASAVSVPTLLKWWSGTVAFIFVNPVLVLFRSDERLIHYLFLPNIAVLRAVRVDNVDGTVFEKRDLIPGALGGGQDFIN